MLINIIASKLHNIRLKRKKSAKKGRKNKILLRPHARMRPKGDRKNKSRPFSAVNHREGLCMYIYNKN